MKTIDEIKSELKDIIVESSERSSTTKAELAEMARRCLDKFKILRDEIMGDAEAHDGVIDMYDKSRATVLDIQNALAVVKRERDKWYDQCLEAVSGLNEAWVMSGIRWKDKTGFDGPLDEILCRALGKVR